MTTQALSISMPLRDWLFVDAEMDNSAQNAIEVEDDQVATQAHAIRAIGWIATGHTTDSSPRRAAGHRSEQVSVSLTTADWLFVVECLLVGGSLAEAVGHSTDAAWGRALADRIAESLAGPPA
jgi:hypothetical protein